MSRYEHKSPDEIERDIVATRDHIDRTLDVLTERLSPSGLFDQALHTVRDTGGEFTLNLGRTIRDNPVPAALLGIGLGWLMVADRRRKAGHDGASDHFDVGYYGDDAAASDGGDGSYRRTIDDEPSTLHDSAGYDGATDGGDGSYRRTVESGSTTSGGASGNLDQIKDKAQRAVAAGRAQSGGARASLVETRDRGAGKAHDVAESARAQANNTREAASDRAERIRAGGRDTAERLRTRGRDAADRMRDTRDHVSARVSERRRDFSDRSSEAMERAREYRAAAGERASDVVHRSGYAVRSAGSKARDAAGSTGQFAREHPLAVGLIVAAAGAVIAGIAPRSRREDELMGEHSDELKTAARGAAQAEVDRMRDAASAAMRTGSEEARRSGLTADDAKRAADEKVAAGIGVAKAAAQAGVDKAEERGASTDDKRSQPAEDVVGGSTADKIKPSPTAEKSADETKPGGVGGVSGIDTPSVAVDRR